MVCFGQKLRERPRCRLVINQLLGENHTLNEIAKSDKYSDNIKIQAKKMLQELTGVCQLG